MDKEKIILACQEHGAKKVYDAAYQRINGDRAALPAVGLDDVQTIWEADRIGREAFKLLGPIDRAADLADITISLAKR